MFRQIEGAEIVESGKTFLRAGIGAVKYEPAVNYGAMRKGDNLLEPRKFFYLNESMRAAFLETVTEHINKVLDSAGVKLAQSPRVKAMAR
jgi:hypothetical protein